MLRRTKLIIVATALAATVASGTATATASAAHIASNSGCGHLRFQPTTNSGTFGCYGNGTGLGLQCWVDYQWANGNYWTNRWFRVTVPGYAGHQAFIHASLVANQYATPRCW